MTKEEKESSQVRLFSLSLSTHLNHVVVAGQDRAKEDQGNLCSLRPLCSPVESVVTLLQVTGKQEGPLSNTTVYSPLHCQHCLLISGAKTMGNRSDMRHDRRKKNVYFLITQVT